MKMWDDVDDDVEGDAEQDVNGENEEEAVDEEVDSLSAAAVAAAADPDGLAAYEREYERQYNVHPDWEPAYRAPTDQEPAPCLLLLDDLAAGLFALVRVRVPVSLFPHNC